MGLSTILLTVDLYYPTRALMDTGSARVTTSAVLTDAVNNAQVPSAPAWCSFNSVQSPVMELIPTDAPTLEPSGWGYVIAFPGVPGSPPGYQFQMPAGPVSFTATEASPSVFTWTPTSQFTVLPLNTGVQVSESFGGFIAGQTYYVVNPSGFTAQLAASPGGTPLAASQAGSGTLSAVSYFLTSLSPVESVAQTQALFPLPSGTPSAGMVPGATGAGEASEWQTLAQLGALANPMTGPGDLITGGSSGAPERLGIGSSGEVLTVTDGVPAWQPASGGVSSFNGRTGAVSPQSGDYTAAQVGADASGAAAAAQSAAESYAASAAGTAQSNAETYAATAASNAQAAAEAASDPAGTAAAATALYQRIFAA